MVVSLGVHCNASDVSWVFINSQVSYAHVVVLFYQQLLLYDSKVTILL